MSAGISYRRIYAPPTATDGFRILVDRVWPRGVSKAAAHLDEWARDIAPSAELRRWYGHEPDRFPEFRRRYLAELRAPERAAAADHLRRLSHDHPITLLTATRDVEHSQAAILAAWLAPST